MSLPAEFSRQGETCVFKDGGLLTSFSEYLGFLSLWVPRGYCHLLTENVFLTNVRRQIVAIGFPQEQTTKKPPLLLDPIPFSSPELTIR